MSHPLDNLKIPSLRTGPQTFEGEIKLGQERRWILDSGNLRLT